ncbi:putative ABC transporter permease protein, partial [Vibrio harveyi]
HAME